VAVYLIAASDPKWMSHNECPSFGCHFDGGAYEFRYSFRSGNGCASVLPLSVPEQTYGSK
jgi:hypothetical protein